jgi:hypothetical protein
MKSFCSIESLINSTIPSNQKVIGIFRINPESVIINMPCFVADGGKSFSTIE